MKISEIEKLVKILEESKLEYLSIKEDNFSLEIRKPSHNQVEYVSKEVIEVDKTLVNNQELETDIECILKTINAPLVGTFYSKPSPESKSFVKIGQSIKKGDTICIIEAMKVMNEIKAEKDLEIVECLLEDGSSVEFNQPLFSIK